jgi:hypothetical protein
MAEKVQENRRKAPLCVYMMAVTLDANFVTVAGRLIFNPPLPRFKTTNAIIGEPLT